MWEIFFSEGVEMSNVLGITFLATWRDVAI